MCVPCMQGSLVSSHDSAPLLFVANICRNQLCEVASMETVMDLSAPQNELFHFEVNHIYVTCQLKRNAFTE